MHPPRDYQLSLIERTSKALVKHQAVIAHAPTGAGKSLVIAIIASRTTSKGRTALVLSETRKIYNQLVTECNGIEINANVKHRTIFEGQTYVGMIQTLSRRPLILEQFKRLGNRLTVLVDECHINTGRTVIDTLKESGCYIIGLTATPFFKFAPHLPEIYNELIEGPQVDDLIQAGHLCNYRHIARTRGDINLLDLRNGEFTEKSNEAAFNRSQVYDGLFEDLSQVPFKKAVIFVASIRHADELRDKLIANGFPATSAHSKSENYAYDLAKFTELNMCDILVTVKSLSKGWDFKPIDLVVLNHATASTSTYLQEIGRGSRIIKGVKEHFSVLDYGDNWKRHGTYYEDRPYSKLWKTKPKRSKEGEGVAPISMCDSCQALVPSMVRICPFCGAERPLTERELEQGELIQVTASYESLQGRNVSTLTPLELSIYAKIKNKQRFAARIAKAREQQTPGFLYEFANAMGYKPSWADFQKRQIGAEKIEFMDITLR